MNDDISIASTQKRIAAFVIDDLVIIFLIFVIFYEQLMGLASQAPMLLTEDALRAYNEEIAEFLKQNIIIIFSIKVLYHTLFVWQNGMTLGKYVLKLRVIELNTGYTPTFSKSLLRGILRIASEAFFYLGFVLAFFLPLKQTLHDKLSNCVVVDV